MIIEKGSIVPELRIEKIVNKGLGLGFYQKHPLFVYQGLPGDEVSVKIIHKRGEVYFGEIYAYLKRSELQIPVKCEVFKDCGGCDWLHLGYDDQLKFKQEIVKEFFNPLCRDKSRIKDINPSPLNLYYRNKIFLPVTQSGEDLVAGMYARRSHKIIPHQRCYIQPQDSEAIIKRCLELMTRARVTPYDEKRDKGTIKYIGLRYSHSSENYILILVTNGMKLPFSQTITDGLIKDFPQISGVVQNINQGRNNKILGERSKCLYGSEYLEERLGHVVFKTHYRSFFQVNTPQMEQILAFIAGYMTPDDVVIDTYSGIGTIGLYLAERVEKVICMEIEEQAVKDGIENCRINQLDNCRFLQCEVSEEIESVIKKSGANTVILDPPRKGVESSILEAISTPLIRKIIYISCDIATQKRDIELLLKNGFRIDSLKAFDMFPQTFHIENVAILTR